MSLKKPLTKNLIEQLVRKELKKRRLEEAESAHAYSTKTRGQRIGRYLAKDLFSKKPVELAKEKHLEAEQRVRELYSAVMRAMGTVPKKLEDKIVVLRDIKEKISQALIWGDNPLLDLVKEETEDTPNN
jgi:hypothetical protein